MHNIHYGITSFISRYGHLADGEGVANVDYLLDSDKQELMEKLEK